MPVILDKPAEREWLDIDLDKTKTLQLLKPCPSEILKAHTVGPLINNKSVNRNRPEIIEKYLWDTPRGLF
jgi:putative SOS response-associated peptidase YedK